MPKKTSYPQQGQPSVTPAQAARLIRGLIERGKRVGAQPLSIDESEAWRIEVEQTLSKVLGENNPAIYGVATASSRPARVLSLSPFGENERDFRPDEAELAVERAADVITQVGLLEAHLRAIESSLEATGQTETAQADDHALKRLLTILDRFHDAARQLRRRHDERPTLKIEDEYDVQDLLHALLLVDFSDIRPEEPAPSHAGAHGRMDLLLKAERIVVEVKKTREKLADRQVGEQLHIDIGRYGTHPDCGILVCFVYDPDSILRNPRGLERDLTKKVSATFSVITVVKP